MYAGAPVANDVRFGYNLGDEARRKLLSYWNAYTFFETYARLDRPDFDEYVPAKESLTDIDRWMILRTNEFITDATAQMDDYKAYNVTKLFEAFVDDITNWYIRSNRRRFWKTDDLFTAINACTKIMAPIIPFMTEHIWQDMTRKVTPSAEESVHLASWPTVIEGFEDDGIVESTAKVRDIIATAMRLRNENTLKVRQPLSKIFVACGSDIFERIKVFEKNLLDELNIKQLVFVEDASALEDSYLAVNFRKAGAVLKQNVNKMKQALESADAAAMARYTAAAAAGEDVLVDGFDEAYPPEIFLVQTRTKEGIVSAESADKTVVALDTVLTDSLIREGIVRDVIRQCQIIRKETGYDVEQRVVFSMTGSDETVLSALRESRDFMRAELLADDIAFDRDLSDPDESREVKIADAALTVNVKKA